MRPSLRIGKNIKEMIIRVLFKGIIAKNEIAINNGRLRCKNRDNKHPHKPKINDRNLLDAGFNRKVNEYKKRAIPKHPRVIVNCCNSNIGNDKYTASAFKLSRLNVPIISNAAAPHTTNRHK